MAGDRSLLCVPAIVWLIAGCASNPPPPRAGELPPEFQYQTVPKGTAWPSAQWYKGFASTELSELVDQAERNNLDLAMARARLVQANARARQAGAAILPNVDANANANFLAGHSSDGSAHELDWSALLSASYEVDFWGKNRATARAAHYRLSATQAERDTVALTTLAGVANSYFQVLSVRERLAVARSNKDAARRLLDAVTARYGAGLANPVEVASQKAVLAAAQVAIPDLQQQESEAMGALALLLGRVPEGFSIQARSLSDLAEPAVGAGIPASLLTRRPDIFTAEANMRAANADLAAARAALFPSLNLTLSGGIQNPALQAAVITLGGVGPTVNAGASLMQAIFDGGRLRAARAEAQAKHDELVSAYRAAILSALIDVENALAALRHLDDARDSQIENVTESERAFEGAQLRYQEGAGDLLTTLEAQRTVFSARDQFSQYKLARLRALVALCKALGGGWRTASS